MTTKFDVESKCYQLKNIRDMKTSKTNSKSGNSSKEAETVKSKKVTASISLPHEEEIRERAREIYHQRVERGEHGTPENDWFDAENYLRETVV
jgi:hypothetical protein